MSFLDNSIYFFTIAFVFIGLIFLILFKKQFLIYKWNKHIRMIIFLLVIINTTIFTIYQISRGGWHHILLTDMCPFIAVVSIPACILDSQKWYKATMPWLVIGAITTMSTSHPGFADKGFMGGMPSYTRHLIMIIQGIIFIFLIKGYERKDYLLILIMPFILFIWIMIAALIPWAVTGNVKWAVYSTAVLEPAYHDQILHFAGHTEISGDYKILSHLGMPYPLPSILFYIVTLVFTGGIAWTTPFFAMKSRRLLNKFIE